MAVLPLLVLTLPAGPPHLRPLSIDPFPDEGRTVSKCAAIGFDNCQEPDGVAIDQIDVLEIDGEGAADRPERGTKDAQVFPFQSPTYVQDLQIFFNDPIDSAGHCVSRLEGHTSRRPKVLKTHRKRHVR